jgi:rsbT antagonist protein RsbS
MSRVLPIPIIKLWDLLLVPLQGEISDLQSERLSQEVLERIDREGAYGLIIDVTGLWLLDSHLCSVVSTLASSAHLMGAQTILSGLSPEIAITLQAMDLDLVGVTTVPTLEEALESLEIGPVRVAEEMVG